MLWSLTKILVFVAVVAAATFGATFLLEMDGGVTISEGNWEFTLGPLQAAIGIAILVVLIWFFLKLASFIIALLRFINGDETAFSRFFDRNRERRGFEALADGLMALASGDADHAMTKAKKADRLLNRPELTNLVLAQASEQTGDKRKAEETYKTLLKHDKTRFVGVYGLLKQKLDAGETDTALKLAEKAFALKPAHVETQNTLLKLQTSEEDWAGARTTLGAKLKHGDLPRDVHKRRDGVLALSEARDLRMAGKIDESHERSIEANRLTPGLVPAAVLVARGYAELGKPKLSERVLRAAWEINPHPELAAAYAAIAADEDPAARLKRFDKLVRLAPENAETKMLLAELNITAEKYDAARTALGDLIETDPTMRSITIMAAIERGTGAEDHIVREWLSKALQAQRDPEWVCENCGEVHKEWEPVCESCAAFDSLTWKRPTQGGAAPALILPLIADNSTLDAESVDDVVLLDSHDDVLPSESSA